MSEEPPKIDPYEARERERERWKNPRRSRRDRSPRPVSDNKDGGDAPPGESGFSENYVAYGLLAGIGLLLLGQIPRITGDSRLLFAEAGAALLLLLLGICRRFADAMGPALLRGPNPFILLLAGWSIFAFFNAPFRVVAAADLLRVGSGIAVYFLAAYALRGARQQSAVIIGVLGFGIILALLDFARMGRGSGLNEHFDTNAFSLFGTHGNVGSLLVVLFPVALSFALHGEIEEKRRLLALGGAIILGAALLASRTRSAWAGAVFALIALSYFFLRYGPGREERRPRGQGRIADLIGSPVALLTVGFLVFALLGGLAPILSKRAATVTRLTQESTFVARLNAWKGAALMSAEKPLTGWGLGGFMILQSQWTHEGDEPYIALQLGTDQRNMAHNYYFQWAADAGLIGLFLYGAAVTAFLLAAFSGAKEASRTPFRMALLSGSVAAIVGGLVDAIASPAYNFHGVNAVFWLWLGLGVAALRPVSRGAVGAPALAPTRWTHRLLAILGGVLVILPIVVLSFTLRQQGKTAPAGKFEIIPESFSPITPGVPDVWTAHYLDGAGTPHKTYPGTIWRIVTEPETEKQTQAATDPDAPAPKLAHSRFRLQIPIAAPPSRPVTIQATYRDEFGRIYTASAEKKIR